jgi:hypothetical protein
MKKIVISMCIVALCLSPSICFSSYLIKLKKGGEFITDQYWEENNHIRFYAYGGLLDFPKNDIHSITDSNLAVPKESIFPSSTSNEASNTGSTVSAPDTNVTENTPSEASAKSETSAQHSEVTVQKETIKEETTKTENEKLLAELNSNLQNTLNELREATRNRDDEGKTAARKKLRDLTNQIYELKEKMK